MGSIRKVGSPPPSEGSEEKNWKFAEASEVLVRFRTRFAVVPTGMLPKLRLDVEGARLGPIALPEHLKNKREVNYCICERKEYKIYYRKVNKLIFRIILYLEYRKKKRK
jgi:hypothetical protein